MRNTVLREKGVETCEKTSIFKALRDFRATPKPWGAVWQSQTCSTYPPAPAKNPARKCRVFTFYLLTLHFSLIMQDFGQVIGNSEDGIGNGAFQYFRLFQPFRLVQQQKSNSDRRFFAICGRSFYLFTPTQFLIDKILCGRLCWTMWVR